MKVLLFKLKENYKIFREGTIFELIGEKLLVHNEFSRCIEKDFFNDINLNKTFKELMENFGSMKIEETAYYCYNMRHFDNNIKNLEERLQQMRKEKNDFMRSVGFK